MPDQLPSLRCCKSFGVLLAKVIGVWFVHQGQLAKHRRAIFVRIGEGGYGLLTASHLGAGPSVHRVKNTMAL